MSSIRELRRRIRAIKNIGRTTKALQMVASSKMRKAQARMLHSQTYASQIQALTSQLTAISSEEIGETEQALLQQRPVRNVGLVVITPDHNLCGALPSNINREVMATARDTQRRLTEQGVSPGVSFIAVGRRGRDFLMRSQEQLLAEFTNYGDWPSLKEATAIAQVAVDAFLSGDVDLVLLVYARFVSTISQRPAAIQLLPVQASVEEPVVQPRPDYIYEPGPEKFLAALLTRHINAQVYTALLETIASEQAAQMVAMKNATDNANSLVQDLTLVMNKARQANITTQILEVAAGSGL